MNQLGAQKCPLILRWPWSFLILSRSLYHRSRNDGCLLNLSAWTANKSFTLDTDTRDIVSLPKGLAFHEYSERQWKNHQHAMRFIVLRLRTAHLRVVKITTNATWLLRSMWNMWKSHGDFVDFDDKNIDWDFVLKETVDIECQVHEVNDDKVNDEIVDPSQRRVGSDTLWMFLFLFSFIKQTKLIFEHVWVPLGPQKQVPFWHFSVFSHGPLFNLYIRRTYL